MIKGLFNLPWYVWAAAAFIIALLYSFVWPKDRIADLTGFRFLVLRWGHALTWLLISINFMLRGFDHRFDGLASLTAVAGGLIYLLFIIMSFVMK